MSKLLSDAQVRVLENTEHLGSEKYVQIPTANLIQRFVDNGFDITTMQQANYRKSDREGKVKHLVRLGLRSDTDTELRREVVLFNSSDRSSSLRLNFGMTRFVCMNGLVAGDMLVPEVRIKHTMKNPFDRIDEFADSIKSVIHEEELLRQRMKNQRLSFYDMHHIAEYAVSLREDNLDMVLDPTELLLTRRVEDQGKDLFTVFNRIQENLVKGSYTKIYTGFDEDGEPTTSQKKTKILTDKQKYISVNKKLHQFCAEMVM